MFDEMHEQSAGTQESKVLLSHPLFDHTVLLRTNPSDELYLAIKRIIIVRETGCVFTGAHRIGKTDALDRVKTMLHQQYPSLCIYSHDAHNQQLPSVRAFFKHFLSTVGHAEKKGETYDLRERLVNVLVDDARTSGSALVVMFIDEASAMLLADFLFLKDVFNDLSRQGVQLITILMGQAPDMQHVIDDLIARGRGDLVARFTNRVIEFRAFNCIDDIWTILSGIDTREHPVGSGISWTAFFLPQAYQNGFRLIDQSQYFMDAILANVSGLAPRQVAFPAGATFLAIRNFLLSAAAYDASNIKLPDDIWHTAVRDSLLQEAIARMNSSPVRRAKRGKR